jgi:hypothetical protein
MGSNIDDGKRIGQFVAFGDDFVVRWSYMFGKA